MIRSHVLVLVAFFASGLTWASDAPAGPQDPLSIPDHKVQSALLETPPADYATGVVAEEPITPASDVFPTTVAAAPSAVAPAAPQRSAGFATRQLFSMQASGEHSAPRLPLLAPVANSAYKRYLASFNHSIPEFFDATVGQESGGK